jgi:hypothetical protein
MLRNIGGELPPQATHGVFCSRESFHRFLRGERGSLPGTPQRSAPPQSDIPHLAELPSSLSKRLVASAPSITASSTRTATAEATGSSPITPRRWEGGRGLRQGDTILI